MIKKLILKWLKEDLEQEILNDLNSSDKLFAIVEEKAKKVFDNDENVERYWQFIGWPAGTPRNKFTTSLKKAE